MQWSAGTALLGGANLLAIAVAPATATAAGGVAVDKSSTGELAVWALPAHDSEPDEPAQADGAPYAAAALPQAWPLTGAAVEAARARLVQSVAAERQRAAVDALSFRLRVSGPGRPAEVWTRVSGPTA